MNEHKDMITYWDNAWDLNNLSEVNQFAKTAAKVMRKEHKNKILDLGCGNGIDALFFYQMGFRVIAVDFAKKTITSLIEKYPEIIWINEDIRDFKETGKQEVVYAHLSLHYFNDSETVGIFNQIFDILEEDGLLFIKCKSIKDPFFGKGKHIDANRYYYGHARNFFTTSYMMEKLKQFKIVSITESAHKYHGTESAFIEAIAKR